MELLEFKKKLFNLCGIKNTSEVSKVLKNVVLKHDVEFYQKFLDITDDSRDWLQALWQYYEADRENKKQDYTPKSLCQLVAALADSKKSVYDCCGGSGALTLQIIKAKETDFVCIEELDEKVIPFLLFNLSIHNASGVVYNKNVLTKEIYKKYKLKSGERFSTCEEVKPVQGKKKYDVAISNPPFNIRWNPPTALEALVDNRFPVIPPASSANFAFVLNCLNVADKSVLILPNGITTENSEKEVREYLVTSDFVEACIIMPQKMFESTDISTCVLVLNKKKGQASKGKVVFVDSRQNFIEKERLQNGQYGGASHTKRTYAKTQRCLSEENISKITAAIKEQKNIAEFSAVTSNEEIAKNEYALNPSMYIPFESKEEKHRDFQEIADSINFVTEMQNSCKLVINETIAKKLGLEVSLYKDSKANSEKMKEQMQELNIQLLSEDYIQFTKNKNEFAFKCNTKEGVPDILFQFFSVWKNQIALLNTMSNSYIAELRDALLLDLMSGKIEPETEE